MWLPFVGHFKLLLESAVLEKLEIKITNKGSGSRWVLHDTGS